MHNVQKLPFVVSLNAAIERKVQDAIQLLGKALPASVVSVSNSIVTVKFEINSAFTLPNVAVPLAGPQYIRYPIQVGDPGVVLPADAYLGGVSGMGGGVADLSIPANLSALVFLPIANKNWTATDDPNAIVLYGPDGSIIRTTSGTCKVAVNSSGVTITLPSGKSVVIPSLPTSAAGLPAGALWNNGNVVNVVP